jgi:hypothetical protein
VPTASVMPPKLGNAPARRCWIVLGAGIPDASRGVLAGEAAGDALAHGGGPPTDGQGSSRANRGGPWRSRPAAPRLCPVPKMNSVSCTLYAYACSPGSK